VGKKGEKAMLTVKRVGLMGGAGLVLLVASLPVRAHTYSDQGAAILIWPKVVVKDGPEIFMDTMIQMSSVNPGEETTAHCIYVNANNHCTNTGKVCSSSLECIDGESIGSCLAGWIETNFDVVLTAEQPIAWSASEGLGGASFEELPLEQGYLPCPGIRFGNPHPCPQFPIPGVSPGDQSNAGTMVPAVAEAPFIGELKCIQADEQTRRPFGPCGGQGQEACPADFLTGTAYIQRYEDVENDLGSLDVAQYNAVGLKSTSRNDGNGVLQIGGNPNSAEYEPCPRQLVFDHLFDGALDPIDAQGRSETELTLVPCTQDLRTQIVTPVNALFLIYNEFEQRYSTTKQVRCLLDSPISRIDTSQPTRSVFHAAVTGTIAGQTFIDSVGGGLVGVALLKYQRSVFAAGAEDEVEEGEAEEGRVSQSRFGSAAYSLAGLNERSDDPGTPEVESEGDQITIP
jgi:hypothetical protein